MDDSYSENDPWITLAIAVVYQATLDVHYGHPAVSSEAKLWLEQTGVDWCQVLNIPENVLKSWADNNFCLLDNPQRNWRY